MSRKRNVESEGGVVFIDPKMKALSSLDGEIGWLAAFPYGLQHVLAMFVANLAPIAIIAAAAGLPEDLRATLIQNAMFIAGIGTFVQLFPLWRGGQRASHRHGHQLHLRLRGLHHCGDPGLRGARGSGHRGRPHRGAAGFGSPAGGGVSSHPSWRPWW